MRIVVEIRKEDEKPLERQAFRDHRSVREHAAYLLHLKIQEIERETERPVVARAS